MNKILLGGLGLLAPALGMAIPEERPNIILIMADDMGWGDVGFNGNKIIQTPCMDSLASNGIVLERFYSAAPLSSPTRASVLTGRHPFRTGVFSANVGILRKKETTLAEVLKEQGYATGLFGKWHLGDAKQFLPLQNGFDEYYGLPYSNDMWPFHPQQGEVFNFPDLPTYDGNEIIGYNTDQSQFTTDYTNRTVNFIKKNKNKPFFIYLAHSMPHVPLAVSDKFKGKSEQGLYGDVMMELDWSVGEVLKALREQGLEENTLIVLTSDNGPWTNYGNHAGSAGGLREAKATTFDGGNRIPCVMYWKGVTQPGTTCNKLASNIDLLPTLAEISGAPLPQRKIDGVSVLPLIKGEKDANPRESFVYYYHKNDLEAVTDGMFKLVFPHKYVTYGAYVPGNDGQPGQLTNLELKKAEMYDLRRDPGERYDVISQYPEEAAKLMKIADDMRKDLGDNLTRVKGTGRREPGKLK